MKQKLKDILENPRGHCIAVDLDGTLCNGVFWGNGDPTPRTDMIEKVWGWYRNGGHIIIYTARQPKYYPETLAWLIKNEVPFHGIAMLYKPGADLYIDDNALNDTDV